MKRNRTIRPYEMLLNEQSALALDISVLKMLKNCCARANLFASLGCCDKK